MRREGGVRGEKRGRREGNSEKRKRWRGNESVSRGERGERR